MLSRVYIVVQKYHCLLGGNKCLHGCSVLDCCLQVSPFSSKILLRIGKSWSSCHRLLSPHAGKDLIHGRDSYNHRVRKRNASHQSTCFFFYLSSSFLQTYFFCRSICVCLSSQLCSSFVFLPLLVLFKQNGTISLLQSILLFGTSDFATIQFSLSNCMDQLSRKLSGTKRSVCNEEER